jgi:hypothetical protein
MPIWSLWEREKSLNLCRESKPRRPASSPSLYRLSYPDSQTGCKVINIKLFHVAVLVARFDTWTQIFNRNYAKNPARI